jgi:hypothetical protein
VAVNVHSPVKLGWLRPATVARLVLAVASAAGVPVIAAGQTTAPAAATQPATDPTPRDTLRSLAAALADADGIRLLDVVHAPTEPERHFVTALAANLSATGRMRSAIAKAFGEAAAERFGSDPAATLNDALSQIDQAQYTVEGDQAIVRYANGRIVALVKQGTRWLVPLSQFPGAGSPEASGVAASELLATARVADALAADVAIGRHKSADAAWQAWRGRLATAMGGGKPPTSKTATTQPATAPITTTQAAATTLPTN